MIPQETVNLILDTAQIADVVADYVTLRRRGANFAACCPFHNEKTPSFYVSPAKGIYKCFGCGKSGSAVGFVMEQEHCTYPDALRYLARKYNIHIEEEERSEEEKQRSERRESLMLVSAFAQKFFHDALKTGEGRSVGYAYFRSRGLEDETIERFGLGWAPGGRTTLIDAALAAGYKPEYLEAAGLAVRREDGSLNDRFRERVMFPVHSVGGRVIAFSGRTLRSDNPAKYVNSPETEIYIKSRNLLGIWLAKSEISRMDKCILVEGNIDMVMMHQHGIRNVVASCGTSLTVEQVRLIHKFTSNITIMYDGDSAGIHAAMRGLSLVLSEGLDVKIVLLPEGEDPDSFCRKHTLEEVLQYIERGEKDFITFKTELLLRQASGDPLAKARLINDIADTIAEIPDPVKRSTYVEFTASRFNVESSILFERIASVRQKRLEQLRQEAKRTAPIRPPYGGTQVEARVAETSPVVETLRIENRILAETEKDLLFFLLTHGCDELKFESDSYFCPENEEDKPTVADFIRDALESDGTSMANSVYDAVYCAYFGLYDRGYSQEEIVRKLLDSPDRDAAAVVASLSSERYELSVSSFRSSMTTTDSWLVTQVPKTIMLYAERRLQDRYESLVRELATAGEADQLRIMQSMKTVQAAQRSIRQKIGREKKDL